MRHLGGIDTMFVTSETPSMHLHVVGVLVLDPAGMHGGDHRAQVRQVVSDRLPLLPPLRWRLVETPGGLDAPRWIDEPDFDLDNHVRLVTLPAPGDGSTLERFVAEVAGRPLDRGRPLWEMHIVDGVADGSLAVVTKIHHALMDGGAGAQLMASLFDLEPDDERPRPIDDWSADQIPTGWRLLAEAPVSALGRLSAVPRAVSETVKGLGGLVGSLIPREPAARSPFNGRLTPLRSVALSRSSLADVKAIRKAFGTTVNDVVLAAVATSLRTELDRLGELDDQPLRAAVPVSDRGDDAEGFGNQTSMMMVPLPTMEADPVQRLRTVHESAALAKEHHRAMGSELIETWAGLVPPWATSIGSTAWATIGVGRLRLYPFNLIISNVPGPPIPLYMAGARVTATYPLGPLMEGAGLNITVLSQDEDLHIGVIACPDLVEHTDAIAAGIVIAVDEMLAAIPSPRKATQSRAKSRS